MKKKLKRKGRKKFNVGVFVSIPILALLLSWNLFFPKADIKTDTTDILKLAKRLSVESCDNEKYTAKEAEKILKDAFKEFFVKADVSNNCILIGVYETNGDVKIIERITFN